MYSGLLIKESLENETILDLITIDKVELWKVNNHTNFQPKYWTAISFSTNTLDFIDNLSKILKEKWYVDLNIEREKIIVFKNKIFRYQIGDQKIRQQAIDYSIKIGIPESQTDWSE